MSGADDENAAWASEFTSLLVRQASAALEQFRLIAAEAGEGQAGNEAEWMRSVERIEALWRRFVQEHSDAFVAAWPGFVRELTGLLPLLNRGQPLFAMLAQLWPLLAGPDVLSRAIETRGESLVEGLEQFLASLSRNPAISLDPAGTADAHANSQVAGDSRGLDQTPS